jgi:DNA-3-methyladenine glycosylase II
MTSASGSAAGARPAKRAGRGCAHVLEFTLAPVPPFRLELAAWTIRRRPENLVDRWDGESYKRVLLLDGFPVEVRVRQTGSLGRPRLHIHAAGNRPIPPSARPAITRALERALGLRVDLRPFYRLARGDQKLGELAEKYEGMKPPRFPTVFESLVNGITCQQFSLTVGLRMLNRLTEIAGPRLEMNGAVCYGFPRPAELARVRPAELHARGYSGAKARALAELSRGIVSGELDLEGLEGAGNDAALERLLEVRGVGRWTAEYTLLRGLGRLDVFPGDDVGARNGLGEWLGLRGPISYERVRRVLRRFEPYAGVLYFLMLLEGLAAAGALAGSCPAREKLEKIESDV